MKNIYFFSVVFVFSVSVTISLINTKNRRREIMNSENTIVNYSIERFIRGYRHGDHLEIKYNNKKYFVHVRSAQCCEDSIKTLRLYYDFKDDEVFEAQMVRNDVIYVMYFNNLVFLLFVAYFIYVLHKNKKEEMARQESRIMINKQFAERKKQKKQKDFEKRKADAEQRKNKIR